MATVSLAQVHANPKAAWELIGVLESEVSERDATIADLQSEVKRLKKSGYGVMVDARQILSVCEQEWRAENAWTEWDQRVIDAMAAWQLAACPKEDN